MLLLLWLLLLCHSILTDARERRLLHQQRSEIRHSHQLTSSLEQPTSFTKNRIQKRATSPATTCGFNYGDPDQPRTAEPGFQCITDTARSLWGFCPTSVTEVSDCSLAGFCVDGGGCRSGCGFLRNDVATIQCGSDFCSTAILNDNGFQRYSYLACGSQNTVVNLEITASIASASSAVATTNSPSPTASSSIPSFTTTSPKVSSNSATSITTISSRSTSKSEGALPSATADTVMSNPSSKEGANTLGAIIGGGIGALALIIFSVFGVLFLRRRKALEMYAPYPSAATSQSHIDDIKLDSLDFLDRRPRRELQNTEIPAELPSWSTRMSRA